MLTADLVRPRLRRLGTELSIEMLNIHDSHWQQTAQNLIALFQQHVGSTQSQWDQALATFESERIDYIVIRGLAKVLHDAATFTPLDTPIPPAVLRERLFTQGPVFAAASGTQAKTRQAVIQEIANELAVTTQQIEDALFADRPANYILHSVGPAWTAEGLLARYNLELARGVLYWANRMHIEVHDNYKDLWKFIKLFKLMFWIQAQQDGYAIELDGPISPFVSATTRYGRQLAAFLPALLHCNQWQMSATVQPPASRGMVNYQLNHTTALQSHFRQSGPFDSRLEADFAREFAEKFGEKRGQWLLTREDEVLPLGDTVMIPDFALTHKQHGYRILIELVGFWHPTYLRRKLEKVRAARCAHLLLLVYKGLNVTEEAFHDTASEVIFFQQKPVVKEVMATVENMAERLYGAGSK